MNHPITHSRKLTPHVTDQGSFPLGPLAGFGLFLLLSSIIGHSPVAGILVTGLAILAFVVGFTARRIRQDQHLNNQTSAAWWATQPRPTTVSSWKDET